MAFIEKFDILSELDIIKMMDGWMDGLNWITKSMIIHSVHSFIHSFFLAFIHSYNKTMPKNTKETKYLQNVVWICMAIVLISGGLSTHSLVENVSILKLIVSVIVPFHSWNVSLHKCAFANEHTLQFFPISLLANDRWMSMPLSRHSRYFFIRWLVTPV